LLNPTSSNKQPKFDRAKRRRLPSASLARDSLRAEAISWTSERTQPLVSPSFREIGTTMRPARGNSQEHMYNLKSAIVADSMQFAASAFAHQTQTIRNKNTPGHQICSEARHHSGHHGMANNSAVLDSDNRNDAICSASKRVG
jgi:hypothetical protein